MQKVWCWRCKQDVPMLDDEESAAMYKYSADLIRKAASEGRPLEFRQKLMALVDFYNELCGEDYTNPNAVVHHKISMYGPPCKECGKPLRTKVARFCAYCGDVREAV